MKKRAFLFLAAAAVLLVLCTLSVLQTQNVSANHRQNERNERLIDAVRHDNLDGVRNALKNGGEINSRDHLLLNGDTALIMAAKRRNREMASFLIERGADINATNYQGDTALITAVRIIDPEMVKFLVEQGADINAEALWLADKSKNDEMFFLVKPQDKDILAIENNEETNDDEKFLPIIIKPRTHGLPYIDDYKYDLFLRGPWIPVRD